MKLPQEAILEFQKIYKDKFGILLNFGEAEVGASNFLKLLVLVTSKRINEYGRTITIQSKKQ